MSNPVQNVGFTDDEVKQTENPGIGAHQFTNDEVTAANPLTRQFVEPSGSVPAAAAYGGAGAVGALAKFAGFNEIANSLNEYKRDHPEYAPEHVDKALALLTNPGALLTNVAAGAPQFLATVGAMAIPYAGIPLAAGLNGVIDFQNTYDEANRQGVPERNAKLSAGISGSVSAILMMLPMAAELKYMTNGEKSLARDIYKSAFSAAQVAGADESQAITFAKDAISRSIKTQFSESVIREIVSPSNMLDPFANLAKKVSMGNEAVAEHLAPAFSMAGYGAAGGELNDLQKSQLWNDKDGNYVGPSMDFGSQIDRMAQAALTGIGTSAFLGTPTHMISKFIAKQQATGYQPKFDENVLNVTSKEDYYQRFMTPKFTDEQVKVVGQIFDPMFAIQAENHNLGTPEAAMGRILTLNKEGTPEGIPLAQTPQGIGEMYSKLDKLVNDNPDFESAFSKQGEMLRGEQLLGLIQKPKFGVASDDLRLTGLKNFLEQNVNTRLSLDSVRGALNNNLIELSRSILGGEDGQKAENNYNQIIDKLTNAKKQFSDAQENVQEFEAKYQPINTPEQQQQYQQLLDKMNKSEDIYSNTDQETHDARVNMLSKKAQNADSFNIPGVHNTTELVISWPQKNGVDRYTDEGHYPDHPNYLMDVTVGSVKMKLPTGEVVDALKQIESQGNRVGEREAALKDGDQSLADKLDGPFMSKRADQIKHAWKQTILYAHELGMTHVAFPDPNMVAERWSDPGLKDLYEKLNNPIGEKLLKQYDPQHPGGVDGEIVGGQSGQTLKVFELTSKVINEIVTGQSLFQKRSLEQMIAAPKYEGGQRAVMDKLGGIYTGDFEDHGALLQALDAEGYKRSNFQSTGVLNDGGDGKLVYAGDANGMVMHDPAKMGQSFSSNTQFHEIDQKTVSIVNPKKEFLAQSVNASTTFLRQIDGFVRAFVETNTSADITTPFEEMAHVITKFMNPEQQQLMETFIGRSFDHWNVDDWEKIGLGFQRYLQKGMAPSPELQPVFDKLKQMFGEVYKVIKASDYNEHITTESGEFFDKLFVKDTPEVAVARDAVKNYDAKYEQVASKIKDLGLQDSLVAKGKLIAAQGELEQAKDQFRRAQVSVITSVPNSQYRTDVASLIHQLDQMRTPNENIIVQGFNYLMVPIRKVLDTQSRMDIVPAGNFTNRLIEKAYTRGKGIAGPMMSDSTQLWNKVDNATYKDLQTIVPMGKYNADTKFKQMIARGENGSTPLPPTDGILGKIMQVTYSIQNKLRTLYAGAGGYYFSGNEARPSKAPETLENMANMKYFRKWSQNVRDVAKAGDTEQLQAIVNGIVERNPEDYKTAQDGKDLLASIVKSATSTDVIKNAQLEWARDINNMPTHYMFKGEWKELISTDPKEYLESAIHAQANRIGIVENFGQGDLQKANIADWTSLASTLKVHPGNFEENSFEMLRTRIKSLVEANGDARYDGALIDKMDKSNLKKLASLNDVAQGWTQQDYLAKIKEVKAGDFLTTDGQINKTVDKQLRAFGKSIGGVDTQASFPNLLNDIIGRMQEAPANMMEKLRESYATQAARIPGSASVEDFDRVMQMMQGITPTGYKIRDNVLSNVREAIRFPYLLLKNSLTTFLWNTQVVNTLATGSPLTLSLKGNSVLNFAETMRQTLIDPAGSRALAISMGALEDIGPTMFRDYGVKNIFGYLREKNYALAGGKMADAFNIRFNVNFYNRMAEAWKNGDFTSNDQIFAKQMRLSPEEINEIKKGNFPAALKQQFILTATDRTEIYTSPKFKRGSLENNPYFKAVADYNSYAAGMGRLSGELAKNGFESFQNIPKDGGAAAAQWLAKVGVFVGAAMGVGTLTSMYGRTLSGTLSKQPKSEDDYFANMKKFDHDFFMRLSGDLFGIGLLGPGNRVWKAMAFNGGDSDKVLATLSPALQSLIDLGASVLSTPDNPQGRYAAYPIGSRMWKTFQDSAPPLVAFKNWAEILAHPEIINYNMTKTAVSDFLKPLGRQIRSNEIEEGANPTLPAGSSMTFENPLLHDIVEDVKRQDQDAAMAHKAAYLDNEFKKLQDVEELKKGLTYKKIFSSLRSALESGRPLGNLTPMQLNDFMSQTPADKMGVYMTTDMKYKAMTNMLAPASSSAKPMKLAF